MFGFMNPRFTELNFENRLKLDSYFDNLTNSSASYVSGGENTLKLQVYKILDCCYGECFNYLADKFKDNEMLYNKYADIIFEIGYNRMKEKTYTEASMNKSVSSRDWKEKKPTKNDSVDSLNTYWTTHYR